MDSIAATAFSETSYTILIKFSSFPILSSNPGGKVGGLVIYKGQCDMIRKLLKERPQCVRQKDQNPVSTATNRSGCMQASGATDAYADAPCLITFACIRS